MAHDPSSSPLARAGATAQPARSRSRRRTPAQTAGRRAGRPPVPGYLRLAPEPALAAPVSPLRLDGVRSGVVLVAGAGAVAVAAAATCPPLAACVLGILEVLVAAVLLKVAQRQAVAISLLAALAFVPIRLAAAPGLGGPWGVLHGPGVLNEAALASALLGAGALLAASAMALRCAEGLRRLERPGVAVAREHPGEVQPVGRARAEWMLAEARRGNRLVTLGLVGVDAPAEYELEPGEREWIMGQLDEVLETVLGEGQTVSDHGPWERLLVLPDVWAEDFRDQATGLVKSARQHLRHQVRVALITFPLDGPASTEPLDYLERALEVCRAGRSSVSVGRPRVRRMTRSHEIA